MKRAGGPNGVGLYLLLMAKTIRKGRALYLKIKNNFLIHNSRFDNDGRLSGQRLNLVNIYGPNKDDPRFYQKVIGQVDLLDNVQCIVGGDCWRPKMDRFGEMNM